MWQACIIMGVTYLYLQGIVHEDLKSVYTGKPYEGGGSIVTFVQSASFRDLPP